MSPHDPASAPSPCPAYAHTLADRPQAEWEPLADHLHETAERAATHAAAFGAEEWGRLAGLWHDLGKYQPAFQARLHGDRSHVEHAGAGAALAMSKGNDALPLAFAIAGHHTGLANLEAQKGTTQGALKDRLRENEATQLAIQPLVPPELTAPPLPPVPARLLPGSSGKSARAEAMRRVEIWTRFLFSALVDADFLATEQFMQPGKRSVVGGYDDLPELLRRLEETLAGFQADTPVNRLRAEVLEDCRAAAELAPGLFSLTVPTGGGKTLSSLAFALRHAIRHGLRRVVVVIPYTSIIEQTARVYRDVLGAHNVVEHHSAVDEAARETADGPAEIRRRLAAENWDAPVVVTTNVQFFESLFANRTSRCRKLHNVARSVVVLDEAQALPVGFLDCVLDAMRELVRGYGCSLVLSTATQPALTRRDALPSGLDPEEVREIVRERDRLARALERVAIRWPAPDETTPYADVAAEMEEHDRVLAIVHLRRDARELAGLLPKENRHHLSASMCPAHRLEVLDRVRALLKAEEPCRLVSTQVVEAGVDVDFPVVFRAMAGLDSLAQAAGRCNREGRRDRGDFIVFRAETQPPPGTLRKGLEAAEGLLRQHGHALSFSDAGQMEAYFRSLYFACDKDARGVQNERAALNFATVAELVRLIEDGWQRPLVAPWGEGPDRLAAFRADPSRATNRALQPFLVQVPVYLLRQLQADGAVESVHDDVHVLTPPYEHLYHREFGLLLNEPANADPTALVL